MDTGRKIQSAGTGKIGVVTAEANRFGQYAVTYEDGTTGLLHYNWANWL